jgi:hypothetical protein
LRVEITVDRLRPTLGFAAIVEWNIDFQDLIAGSDEVNLIISLR